MCPHIPRPLAVVVCLAVLTGVAPAQTTPAQRIGIDAFPRILEADDPAALSVTRPALSLYWDNGPRDDVTAHLSQVGSFGGPDAAFLAADDFFVKEGLFACVERVTFCFIVSDVIDGAMRKPVFGLTVYNDCDGRPDTIAAEFNDPDKITATLLGPSAWLGFNLWEVTFEIDDGFVDGYQRPWLSPRGFADFNDALYYWVSANNGNIQGAQAQVKNDAEPWMDVQTCDCPGICTDLYFRIEGRECCLAKDNTPFATNSGSPSIQVKGATIDTARAADNFQIEPDGPVELCRVEAWMATNCPLDKVFLEIYENDCNRPGAKLYTIDPVDVDGDGEIDYPAFEDTGLDFDGCDIYRFAWKIRGVTLAPGRDYWLSVVARGTGSILDKALWMHKSQMDPCHINITEGVVKDPFVEGMEDWILVSEDLRTSIHHDFAFRLFTSSLSTPPPPLGACCQPDGGCVDAIIEADCLSLTGVFVPGASCASTSCLAACCLPDGTCVDGVAGMQCAVVQGGTWQGPDSTCATVQCAPPLTVACCFPDGSCTDLLELDCLLAGGTFGGSDCATASCTVLIGACCDVDTAICFETTAVGCELPDVSFLGPGTTCASDPCTSFFGACCLDAGSCIDQTLETECSTLFGVYVGVGTDCATVSCSMLFGACCNLETGMCFETTADGCELQNVSFQGLGTTCATTSCPQPTGACCFEGSCFVDEESICLSLGGEFFPDDDCSTVSCPLDLGACCIDAVGCIVTDEFDCLAQAGLFSPGADCATAPCPGACCLDNAPRGDDPSVLCVDVPNEADCQSLGGVFFPGFDCTSVVCGPGGVGGSGSDGATTEMTNVVHGSETNATNDGADEHDQFTR